MRIYSQMKFADAILVEKRLINTTVQNKIVPLHGQCMYM